MQAPKFSFSCVVDRKEKFFIQAQRWATSLIKLGKVSPENLYVHIVQGEGYESETKALQRLGVNIVAIDPFDAAHPYCNKLQQLSTMQVAGTEYVVLMDCDTVVTGPFNPELTPGSIVHAKPVDFAIPPQHALTQIFAGAGVPITKWITSDLGIDTGQGVITDWNNCNGGIYIILSAALKHLQRLWHQAAHWCIENKHLFQNWTVNIDQVSFALAMSRVQLKVTHLSRVWNFPTHVQHPIGDGDALVIHYHDQVDQAGLLKKTGLPLVDKRIDAVNAVFQAETSAAVKTYGANDIGSDQLVWSKSLSETPELLEEMAEISRRHFGWFTKHSPRAFEYPWVAKRLGEVKGKIVLDIGAGVAPLPLYLAEKHATVLTIDSSTTIRQASESRQGWNEWGFFDYSGDHKGITSHHADILKVTIGEGCLDAVYSVSVIEHMPAETRKSLWPKVATWLKPGGLLALTVDLVPGTKVLWNFNSGVIVEDASIHGDLRGMEDELASAGFILKRVEYLHNLPDSKVDVAMLLLVREKQKA